jgi:tetratricopeptide (TPR) repeat protein
MKCAKLTDDGLWRAITQNPDELSALIRHLDARHYGKCLGVALRSCEWRLALSALAIALTIAGCSPYAMPDKSASARAKPIKHTSKAYKTAVAYPQFGTHGYHGAPEATPLAPNCELTGQEPDTIDADLWGRLKLDYERHCYKQAETFVRKRLQQLLASGRRGPAASPAPSVAPVPIAAPESAEVVSSLPLSPTERSARDTSEGVAAPVKDARFYYAQGVSAYHDGDVARAIVDFSLATGRDPNFKNAYIDLGIAWYRIGNFDRAFADIAQVMRIENSRTITIPPLPKTLP